jgi:pyruvate decarboxylase
LKATIAGELTEAIRRAREHTRGPVLIECQIANDDCSTQLIEWAPRVVLANGRPPQSA